MHDYTLEKWTFTVLLSGVIAAILLSGALLAMTAPTQADIDACVKTTNYTAERCKLEMMK